MKRKMASCNHKRIVRRLLAVALLALPLGLAGCRERAPGHARRGSVFETVVPDDARVHHSDTASTEMKAQLEKAAVLQRVRDIYTVVRAEFMRRGSSVENELLDKAYCSKSWNKLLMAVHYKENLTGTLFFELNHWSMTQDSELVTFEEFEVTDIYVEEPVMTASVAFTVYGMDSWTPAKINLVYEDGQWKIDNFQNLKYMLDVKERMWYYLQHDMMY